MSATKKKSYRELKSELDLVMQWFDSGDVDVDEALAKHEEARKLLEQLEAYLTDTEQKITRIS